MLRLRLPFFRLLAPCVLFSAATRADELDPVMVIEADATTSAAPLDRALRPLEWLLRTTHPVFSYSYAHAEGVLSSPGSAHSTTVQAISLSVYSNLGQFATIRYQPSWTFYSSDAFENNFGQEAGLNWRRGFTEWNVRLDHRYSRASAPLIETGSQTSQETHHTSLGAQRQLGARTTLELGLQQRIRLVDTFNGSRVWSTEDWLHYQVSGALGASAGVGVGLVDTDEGADMRFSQLHGRVRWRVGERLRFDVRGGVESRDFTDSERDNATTPIYGAKLIYQPLETTTLTIAGDQSVSASYLRDRVHRANTWQAGLSQRLLGRLHLDLFYVHRGTSFSSTTDSVTVGREDDGRSLRATLRTAISQRGLLSVFYQDKHNRSSDPRFGFRGRQTGVAFSLRY